MQASATSAFNPETRSAAGASPVFPLPALNPFRARRPVRDIRDIPFASFAAPPKHKGWARKALEFIDSGPPALLNNPCCCRRVVLFFHQTCNGGSLWLKKRKPRSRRL